MGRDACRSLRLEYNERVCLTSASDGVLYSLEYRLLVGFAERRTLILKENNMKLVAIDEKLIKKYKADTEVLHKKGRPYVLVIRLKYKGKNQDFAIPLRSNIPASSPKNEYFALPPRSSTKPKNRHGIHYIKMFPVEKKYLNKYRTEGNKFAVLIQDIIDKNSKQIISECQTYLFEYEKGIKSEYSTDIDLLLSILKENN